MLNTGWLLNDLKETQPHPGRLGLSFLKDSSVFGLCLWPMSGQNPTEKHSVVPSLVVCTLLCEQLNGLLLAGTDAFPPAPVVSGSLCQLTSLPSVSWLRHRLFPRSLTCLGELLGLADTSWPDCCRAELPSQK